MRKTIRACCALFVIFAFVPGLMLRAQSKTFHGAPASASHLTPPPIADSGASGKLSYQRYCASCHGAIAQGSGSVPALTTGTIKSASPGELFWFISKGDARNGMPSWEEQLSDEQRWQIVGFLKMGEPAGAAPAAQARSDDSFEVMPDPKAPFTDYRFERPGQVHKITAKDLPAPYDTPSASNGPTIVPRPQGAWPQAPAGFEVTLYADGLGNPRRLRRAPNGDLFVAEPEIGRIVIFRGIDGAGHPQHKTVFASGLDRPFGMNFFPPGPNPRWVYVATPTAVIRVPYGNGDLEARGPWKRILDLPKDGHISKDIQVEPGGLKILVGVGSFSNADDADNNPLEKYRANILEINPDGSDLQVYAYGIRNPSFMAIDPKTHNLWVTVNERDGLGDDLVPDYITHVRRGGFYGWPWWYMGGHQDPRLAGKHPELKDKVITPDVLVQPHSASVGLTFYDGKQFPAEYSGDIFAAEHGSWNRSVRSGYEVIRVRLHQGKATGAYEDFLTGFAVDNKRAWGRPAGVAIGPDGSLFVADDASNSIWRVKYVGH